MAGCDAVTMDERLALTLALVAAQRERHEALRAMRALCSAEARRRGLTPATDVSVDVPEPFLRRLQEAQERCAGAARRIQGLLQAARWGSEL